MIVVDRRSLHERLLARRENGRGDAPPARLAGALADRLVRRRVASRAAPPPGPLVVSVGNLRVGGTGKTPVVGRLAGDLAARGLAGGVITRGYRAADPAVRVVAADDADAGDEARMLAAGLAPVGWTVVQAPRRDEGLRLVRARVPDARVVLLEDAHQSARVGRHCDVLILDRWTCDGDELRPGAGPVLPFGPYRETAAGARRAGIWLVESVAPVAARGASGAAVTAFARRPVLRDPARVAGARRPGLVSGLARPEGFEAGCAGLLPSAPVLSVRLPDHCRYDRRTVAAVLALGRRHDVDVWLTTAKDEVKLAGRWPGPTPPAVVELAVDWTMTPTLPDLVGERLEDLLVRG